MTDSPILAVTTCADMDAALNLGRSLVEEGLAACSTALPGAISIYKWEGKIQEGREAMLLIKSRKRQQAALEARLIALHSYSTPEFICLEIDSVNSKYLEWLLSVTERGNP